MAAADDAFGAGLYRLLAAGPGGLVFSPASIAAALRLALLGARGDTAAELATALHLSAPEEAGEGLRLLGSLAGGTAAGETVFRAPNTMWLQAGFPVRPEFTTALADLAGAAVRDTDFAGHPGRARREINEAIAGQTAGKIRDLMGPGSVDASTRLVLANAVYLKAAWAHPFPRHATADAPFHPAGGGTVTVPMMRLTARLDYARGGSWQAVLLPYRRRRLAMAIILPDGQPGPAEEELAASGLRALLAAAAPAEVRLGLPRFRLTARVGLVPALRQLGLARPFGPAADFSGIGPGPLFISAVGHQAYIGVNEEGTEAAAATAAAVALAAFARPERPVEVTVDRPFLFAITDTATGLPLFLGRVTRPEAG